MQKQTIMSVIGGAAGSALLLLFVFTLVAVAAPTQAPPNGNPAFPLTGPQGPVGPTGPTGPQGPSGATATFTCATNYNSFTGTSTTVSCPSGYSYATGGGFYLSDGNNNGLNWNDAWARPYGNSAWECGRNIYSGNASYCYVTCCRLQ